MAAKILDGKAIASEMRAEIGERANVFFEQTGIRPHLAAVLVGSDPASQVYVKNKQIACEKSGLASSLHALPADTSEEQLLAVVDQLNRDPAVHGILVQFPLPRGLDERLVVHAIDPLKDVDALHPWTVGLMVEGTPRFLPCTPAGVQEILKRSRIPTAGRHAVVVGRSSLVGRPLSILLSQKGPGGDATVTLCHSRSTDLADQCRRADILVVAAGQPEFITGDMIKPGAVVIDVGIHRTEEGRLVGDVAYEAAREQASAITPVPGGVGPMTVTILLANTLRAAEIQCGR